MDRGSRLGLSRKRNRPFKGKKGMNDGEYEPKPSSVLIVREEAA